MFGQQERAQRVGFEGLQSEGVVDLRGGFFRVQDPRDAEGQVQVGVWEAGTAVRGCGGNGAFVCRAVGRLSRLRKVGRGFKGKEGSVPVTSSCRTSRRSGSTSRPSRMRARVPSRSVRAVATTGRGVLRRRWRVRCSPIPREAGVVRIQGEGMVGCGVENGAEVGEAVFTLVLRDGMTSAIPRTERFFAVPEGPRAVAIPAGCIGWDRRTFGALSSRMP